METDEKEYVILYDRLMDPDILKKLLGREVGLDIFMDYLSTDVINKYRLNNVIHCNKAVMIVKLHKKDLDILDQYYELMIDTDRIAIYNSGKICWIYLPTHK